MHAQHSPPKSPRPPQQQHLLRTSARLLLTALLLAFILPALVSASIVDMQR